MSNKILICFLLFGIMIGMVMKSKTNMKWPKPIQNISEFSSKDGFTLGRALFYDPILSKDSSISCASCHLSHTAFSHVDHPTSHGIADRVGRRNAPGLFNLAWRQYFHWDGGVLNLKGQAVNPLTHPDEMGETLEHILLKLNKHQRYLSFFKRIYKQNVIETWMILDALQQFTLALVSNDSYYDKVQQNKGHFSVQQAQGQQLFEQYCNRCHEAPLFFTNRFESNGITILSNDLGRYEITGSESDKGKFRIPSLRNITHTFPYMHDGRYKNLRDVMGHYAKQFDLTDIQQKDLISFLKTLTDSSFISKPEFQYHRLTP